MEEVAEIGELLTRAGCFVGLMIWVHLYNTTLKMECVCMGLASKELYKCKIKYFQKRLRSVLYTISCSVFCAIVCRKDENGLVSSKRVMVLFKPRLLVIYIFVTHFNASSVTVNSPSNRIYYQSSTNFFDEQ